MKRFLSVFIILIMISALLPNTVSCRKKEVTGEGTLCLETAAQKVVFERDPSSLFYYMKTFAKTENGDKQIFGGEYPFIAGKSFDLKPDTAVYEEDGVLLSGRADKGYDFEIKVSPCDSLIHFEVVCHLENKLALKNSAPSVMLWTDTVLPEDERVCIWQEAPSYQGKPDTYWNSCFPYAYLWQEGAESALYFDMTDMTWFSNNGVRRFNDMQAKTVKDKDRTGIGLYPRNKRNGEIEKGDILFDYYLYCAERSEKPTKMEALCTVTDTFGALFRDGESSAPYDYIANDGSALTWEKVCIGTANALCIENSTMKYSGTPITEAPAFPEIKIGKTIKRPDYAAGGGINAKFSRTTNDINGDWNCRNNALIPLTAFLRLFPDDKLKEVVSVGYNALKAFYDPIARDIRSFEGYGSYAGGGVEFTFQNFFMGMSTLNACLLISPEDFDPSVAGYYLLGLRGAMDMAVNNGYIMPQLIDMSTFLPAQSIDEPDLGQTSDPYTVAIYAYAMCMAHSYTGDEKYLQEAEKAVKRLFENPTISIDNSRFKAVYSDPYDYPINESSSAPWGVAASQYLYKITKDKQYLTLSEYYKAISLRLMRWYESDIESDKTDKALCGKGLFNAFTAANSPTPWENIYCYIPLLAPLANEDCEFDTLLLKMMNSFRRSGLYFSGAAWDPEIISSAPKYQKQKTGYMVSEDFYTFERQVTPGTWGPCVYMSNTPFYAYYMYEAFAECDNENIMTLCTDILTSPFDMINGTERNFIIYNPTDKKIKTALTFKNMLPCGYTVICGGKEVSLSDNSISLSLPPKSAIRVNIKAEDKILSEYEDILESQQKLALLYALLQENAEKGEDISALKEDYLKAKALYADKEYKKALAALS